MKQQISRGLTCAAMAKKASSPGWGRYTCCAKDDIIAMTFYKLAFFSISTASFNSRPNVFVNVSVVIEPPERKY